MRKFLAFILIGLLLVNALPALAQGSELSPEELKLLDLAAKSVSTLMSNDSFKVELTQVIDQTISTGDGALAFTLEQTIEQNSQAQILTDGEGNPSAIQMTLQQTASASTGTGDTTQNALTLESIFINGEFYMRFSEFSPELAGSLPVDWVNAQDFALMTGLNPDAFGALSGKEALAMYPITPETTAAVEELEAQTIDGQAVRVIQITWTSEGLLSIPALSNMFDFSALGLGDDFLQQMFADALPVQTFYIGEADGLLYQIEFALILENVALEVQGTSMTLTQSTHTSAQYFDLNVPVKIVKPVLGQ